VPFPSSVSFHFILFCCITSRCCSFFFQAEAFGTILDGNIAFNGPRAGVNFNDGMGGNNTVTRNVLFNFCRWGGRGEGGWCVFVMCVCQREQRPCQFQQLGPSGLHVRKLTPSLNTAFVH